MPSPKIKVERLAFVQHARIQKKKKQAKQTAQPGALAAVSQVPSQPASWFTSPEKVMAGAAPRETAAASRRSINMWSKPWAKHVEQAVRKVRTHTTGLHTLTVKLDEQASGCEATEIMPGLNPAAPAAALSWTNQWGGPLTDAGRDPALRFTPPSPPSPSTPLKGLMAPVDAPGRQPNIAPQVFSYKLKRDSSPQEAI